MYRVRRLKNKIVRHKLGQNAHINQSTFISIQTRQKFDMARVCAQCAHMMSAQCSYSFVLVFGHTNVQSQHKTIEQFCAQNVLPNCSAWCAKCHKVTWLSTEATTIPEALTDWQGNKMFIEELMQSHRTILHSRHR